MHCEIARQSIEKWIKFQTKYLPSQRFNEEAGCFVTLLDKDNKLRGCIGTIAAQHSDLAIEIAENARSAASRDHRFSPLQANELDAISIEVSVLQKPEIIENHIELNPKIYGIIVENQGRRGVLLPDLDGITTIDQQISIAKHKAFISSKEPVKIWRFKVAKFRE